AQVFLYNEMLGKLQGYTPPCSYLLGRSWKQKVKGEERRGAGCMDRLAPIRPDGLIHNIPLGRRVRDAVAWIRRVRGEGHAWQLLPTPSVPELWPNMGRDGFPWHSAKSRIAKELDELTLLWQVGLPKRRQAHAQGIYRWTDPYCTAAVVGL